MEQEKKQIYCSLDIETSGFDPEIGEILELGMIFFEIEKSSFKLLHEWESTFKPSKEIPPRILALTGIDPAELEDSPTFKEKFAEIQEMLEGAVIVGHNIDFDIKFMQAFGLKFSGRRIDTLDLAQIFLPTNTSYNLEALMNFFKVEYKDVHRALSDSRAALMIFEKMLQHYSSFPDVLKQKLQKLFSKSHSEIKDLLQTSFLPIRIEHLPHKVALNNSSEVQKSLKESNKIVTFPLGFDYYSYIYGGFSKNREKLILVVPNKKILYRLWHDGLVAPLLENRDVFETKRFEKGLAKADDQTRNFFAKVLVWQHTNWQNTALLDMNFTFFGGPAKNLINAEADRKNNSIAEFDPKAKILATDYVTFINHDWSALSDRKLLVLDINNFESALTYVTGKKVSWNDFIYSVKQVYDPATKIGNPKMAQKVERTLAEVDLFFGLAALNWKKLLNDNANLLVTQEVEQSPEYQKVRSAAESFAKKMEAANKSLQLEKIDLFIDCLQSFFKADPGEVRWIESGETHLAFFISPLSLEKIVEQKLFGFQKIIFTASLGPEALIKYFLDRLSLKNFGILRIGQQELRAKVEIHLDSSGYSHEKVLKLTDQLSYPAAVLLPGMSQVKELYESNFRDLQKKHKVYVQGYSGGTTKLLENFAINPNSLFIGTDRFVLKQIGKKMKVKSLIISRLPFEQFTHPLFAAQAQKYENQFLDFNIPRALYNLHSIINFFLNPELGKIYILDSKLNKDYGKYFVDYLKTLPFVEIK